MKYSKPVANIINIENEDIVSESLHSCSRNGSNYCTVNGTTNQRNNYETMGCTGQTGTIYAPGCTFEVFGSYVQCTVSAGNTCWTVGGRVCIGNVLGLGIERNCTTAIGANSLGDEDY